MSDEAKDIAPEPVVGPFTLQGLGMLFSTALYAIVLGAAKRGWLDDLDSVWVNALYVLGGLPMVLSGFVAFLALYSLDSYGAQLAFSTLSLGFWGVYSHFLFHPLRHCSLSAGSADNMHWIRMQLAFFVLHVCIGASVIGTLMS